MRCFVALPLPAEIKVALAAPLRELRAAAGGLKWTDPDSWHLTLAFLGELDAAELERARGALASLGRLPPFTLEVAGLRRLPARGDGRVLALDLARGRQEVELLWGVYNEELRVRERLDAARALNPEYRRGGGGRPFAPHVTLARAGRSGLGGAWRKFGPRMKATGTVASCILYESDLRPAGAVHRACASVALQGVEFQGHALWGEEGT